MFTMKIYSVVTCTDVANDVTYSRKSVNTRVVVTLFVNLHGVIHCKTATSYDKRYY